MAEMMTTDVRALLDRNPFDHPAVADLREVLGRDPSWLLERSRDARGDVLRDRDKSPKADTHLRLGVGEVMLGRYNIGLEHLSKTGDVGLAQFFRGLALENLGRWNEAAEAFATAATTGYEPKSSELHRAGALRRAGKSDEARKILEGLEKQAGSSAEFHYQKGSLLAADGELQAAAAEFEKTLAADRDHTGALFELAYINDLYGNDDAAVDFYVAARVAPPGAPWQR